MEYDQSKSPLLKLLSSGKQHQFPKGQVMHFADERMLLSVLNTGYVKRYSITDDGSQSIQSIYGPGDIFPLTPVFKALFNKDIYLGQEVFYYEAMTPVIMHSVDRETLEAGLVAEPEIYKDLLYVSGVRLSSNIQRLENMSLRVANRKVAHQLVHYANKFGKKGDHGITLQLPLTHQNLASILNLARETVTNCLTALQEKGILESDKNIVILDLDALKRASH